MCARVRACAVEKLAKYGVRGRVFSMHGACASLAS